MRISYWSSDVCSSDLLAHLCSALGLEVAHFLALAEALRGARQTADRLHLVAHEDDGDAEQQDRAADGPEDEDVGGRREQSLAGHQHTQHALDRKSTRLNSSH